MRVIVVAVIVLSVATPAEAAEFTSCWVSEIETGFGNRETITRCRIAGGETTDFGSDGEVPSDLYPNLGTDTTGQCWYYTSAPTDYVILDQFADGSANVGLDTDPGTPGGIVAIGPVVPRCTSEPTAITDPVTDAWDYVMSYIHDPPTPDLNPTPGQGVTGLDTFVGVPVPDDHSATLTSGVSTLEVEIVVDAVIIDWGDATVSTLPADEAILAGYPDGAANHVYELKTVDGSQITVEYDWTARWRLVGGVWAALPVPNTGTSVVYPVAEVVSKLTD